MTDDLRKGTPSDPLIRPPRIVAVKIEIQTGAVPPGTRIAAAGILELSKPPG